MLLKRRNRLKYISSLRLFTADLQVKKTSLEYYIIIKSTDEFESRKKVPRKKRRFSVYRRIIISCAHNIIIT